jgi:hypothetical protein
MPYPDTGQRRSFVEGQAHSAPHPGLFRFFLWRIINPIAATATTARAAMV